MRQRPYKYVRQESCCGMTIRKIGGPKNVWVITGVDGKRIDSALTREVARKRCRRLKLFAETPDAAPGNERS
jgi:hypothetical protein